MEVLPDLVPKIVYPKAYYGSIYANPLSWEQGYLISTHRHNEERWTMRFDGQIAWAERR